MPACTAPAASSSSLCTTASEIEVVIQYLLFSWYSVVLFPHLVLDAVPDVGLLEALQRVDDCEQLGQVVNLLPLPRVPVQPHLHTTSYSTVQCTVQYSPVQYSTAAPTHNILQFTHYTTLHYTTTL